MTIDERVQQLELAQKRLEAVVEIQNLVATYSYYHASNLNAECVALFAQKTPGVAVDIPHIGVYDSGIEGIRRCYAIAHNGTAKSREDFAGMMMLRPFTTPLIQVARDGKTARGLWLSPGITTAGSPKTGYSASWAWIKYGCDFVLEDGTWKIWHLRVFGIFLTPYDKSWVESATEVTPPEVLEARAKMMAERKAKMPPEAAPDRTNEHYDWTYAPDKVYPADMPVPPVPYDTWDDSMSMMNIPEHHIHPV